MGLERPAVRAKPGSIGDDVGKELRARAGPASVGPRRPRACCVQGAGAGAAEGAWAVGGGASAWAGLAAAARIMPWGLRAWGGGTGTR